MLGVHAPSGQLGIIEFKDSTAALPEARRQVQSYGRYWQRDCAEFVPFFARLLNRMGDLYDGRNASRAGVNPEPAALFVGVAQPGREPFIQEV